MFKFFRRYNKWILAVGGTLLLVAFLLADTLPQMAGGAGRRGATWATVGPNERALTNEDLLGIQRELDLLRRVGQGSPVFEQLFALGALNSPEHWYLLTREAEQAGLIAGPSEAMLLLGQDYEAGLGLLVQQTGYREDEILRALARVNGVWRLFGNYQSVLLDMSDRRLKHVAALLYQRAAADVVAITASADAVDYEPTEAEIESQMAQYADVRPGAGEGPFGYRLPDRAQLEWLHVPADSIRALVEASDDMNRIALWQHWSRNTDIFGEVNDEGDIPDEVREDLLNTLMGAKADEIGRFASEALRRPRRGLPQEGGYYQLPDDWAQQQANFADAALEIQERYDIALPTYRNLGDRWVSVDELESLEGINLAGTTRFGPQRVRFPRLVRSLKEFGGEETIPIQRGIASPPLTDGSHNLYIFRVTDADPSRPPASVDEVRDDVVRDLRRIAHYEQIASELDSIEQTAIEQGLLRVGLKYDVAPNRFTLSLADPQTLQIYQAIGRQMEVVPTSLPGIGAHEPTVRTILERARALWASSTPLHEQPESQRVVTVPVETHLTVIVARLASVQPVTASTYRTEVESARLQQLLLNEEVPIEDVFVGAFSAEALAARHNFTVQRSDVEEEFVDFDDLNLDDASEGDGETDRDAATTE